MSNIKNAASPKFSRTAQAQPSAKPSPGPASPVVDLNKQRRQDEFIAMVERMPTPPSADPSLLSARGEQALQRSRKLLGGVVTEGNAKSALAELSALDARDFRLVAGKLNDSRHLETLLGNLPAAGRSRFLAAAAAKGYVEVGRGKAANGLFDPPATPDRYKMQQRLPACVNDAIHAESKMSAAQYSQQFAAYVARYEAGIKACGSREQIAALGHPARPDSTRELIEPGLTREQDYRKDWPASYPSSDGAYRVVSERLFELTGERHDGSMWLDYSLELSMGRLNLKIESSATRTAPSFDLSLSEKEGPVTVTQSALKKTTTVKVESPDDLPAKVEGELKVKDGRVEEVSGKLKVKDLGSAKLGLARNGKLTMELTPQASGSWGEAGLGSFATATPRDATMTGGVQGEVKLKELSVGAKGRLGFGCKGLTAQSARDVRDGKSVFGD